MSTGDATFAAASMLLETFVSVGLSDVCISPGARSTPLALAAARSPRITVHIVLDERSAGFVALGIAKASSRPAAVICTSGTAAANYLPAVVEACYADVPLVVLTADRPPRMRNSGANQTIEQRGLYAAFVRYAAEAPLPEDPAHAEWREIAAEAARRCLSPRPGPVHLNLPFDEPLVPSSSEPLPFDEAELPTVTFPKPAPVNALELPLVERGLVIAGGMSLSDSGIGSLASIATSAAWPLYAEPQSGLRLPGRALTAGAALMADAGFAAAHAPEVVVLLGEMPTQRATLQMVASAARIVIVDPAGHIQTPPWLHAEIVAAVRPPARVIPSAWAQEWARADAAARETIDRLLDTWDEPFYGRIARDLAAALPDRSALCVGSSLPVRELDSFMTPRAGLRVLANRGASGIDGFISTTFGVSATGLPTTALLGDLTFLHDAGGLIWNARRMPPTDFVVVNDNGGGIFSFLPQAALPEAVPLFATPHGIDLAAISTAAACEHWMILRASDLARALAEPHTGSRVFEVRVHRDETVRKHGLLRDAVAAALKIKNL